jgi:hypothetical protein
MIFSNLMPPPGLVIGYFSIVWLFCVPYSIHIFRKFNKEFIVE